MKAFVLAAGFGNRLKPITNTMPKPVLPLVNVPIIHYSLARLIKLGVSELVVNLHYLADKVKDCVLEYERHFNKIKFSYEEDILGTGGGLKKCKPYLNAQDFILINSDIVIDVDLSELVLYHKTNNSDLTLVVIKDDNAEKVSPISLDKSNNIVDINHLLDKNVVGRHVYTGVAICSPKIFDYLFNSFSGLAQTGYIDMIKHGFKVKAFVHTGFWSDIGNLTSYYRTSFYIVNNIRHWRHAFHDLPNYPKINNCNTLSMNKLSAFKNVILPHTFKVGKNVKINNSIVLPNAIIEDSAIINHSIVHGNNVIRIET